MKIRIDCKTSLYYDEGEFNWHYIDEESAYFGDFKLEEINSDIEHWSFKVMTKLHGKNLQVRYLPHLVVARMKLAGGHFIEKRYSIIRTNPDYLNAQLFVEEALKITVISQDVLRIASGKKLWGCDRDNNVVEEIILRAREINNGYNNWNHGPWLYASDRDIEEFNAFLQKYCN